MQTQNNGNKEVIQEKGNKNIIKVIDKKQDQVKKNRQSVKNIKNNFEIYLNTELNVELNTKLNAELEKQYDYSCDLFHVMLTLIDQCVKNILPSSIILVNGTPKITSIVRGDLYHKLYKTTGFRYYQNETEMTRACYQMLFKINNGHRYRYLLKTKLIEYVSKCLDYFPTRKITIEIKNQNEENVQIAENEEIEENINNPSTNPKRKEYVSENMAQTLLHSIIDEVSNYLKSVNLCTKETTMTSHHEVSSQYHPNTNYKKKKEEEEEKIHDTHKNDEHDSKDSNGKKTDKSIIPSKKSSIGKNKDKEIKLGQFKKKDADKKSESENSRHINSNSTTHTTNNNKSNTNIEYIHTLKSTEREEIEKEKREEEYPEKQQQKQKQKRRSLQYEDKPICFTNSAKKIIRHFNANNNKHSSVMFMQGNYTEIKGNESYEYYSQLNHFMLEVVKVVEVVEVVEAVNSEC